MYSGQDLRAQHSVAATQLALKGRQKRLTIYAGAGLSVSAPTSLPGGGQLAGLIQARLAKAVSFDGVQPDDLVGTADRIAGEPGGTALLHDTIIEVAPFKRAASGYGHTALALLLAEGAATVLTTNYDDCIERATDEHFAVVLTDHDRGQKDSTALLKVHGCATVPSSLVATTDELAAAPLFASSDLDAQLLRDAVVFVGLGSPADYVKASIARIAEKVPVEQLHVVDPRMSEWDSTEWSSVVPELAEERRISSGADAFCDQLLSAYLHGFFSDLRRRVQDLPPTHDQRRAVEALIDVWENLTSLVLMSWLRAQLTEPRVGRQAIVAPSVVKSTLAIATLALDQDVHFTVDGLFNVGGRWFLAVADEDAAFASQILVEATRRVQKARVQGQLPSGAPVVVVSSGHVGSLGIDEVIRGADGTFSRVVKTEQLQRDLIDVDDSNGHLIDGLTAGEIAYTSAERLIAL